MDIYFVVIFFCFLIFILRSLPIVMRRDLLLVDHYYHLILAKQIRKNNYRYPRQIEQFLIQKDALVYPFLYHYLLALFPEKFRLKMVHYLSGIFDCFQYLILAELLLKYNNLIGISVMSIKTLLVISGLIFGTYPILMRVGDARNVAASARSLGELLFTLAILSFFIYRETGDIKFFFISVFAGSLVFLSSKFGMQAYLFFSVLLALFYLDSFFILALILSLVMAIMVSFGGYFRVLRAHIAHSNFQRKIMLSANTGYKIILDLPKKIVHSPREAIEDIFKFPMLSIFIHSPLLILIVYFYIADYHLIISNNFYYFFFLLSLISIMVCFLTSFKFSKFLGEAERYGDYSVLAISMVLPVFILNEHHTNFWFSILGIAFMYQLFILSFTFYVWLKKFPSNTSIKAMISFLNSFKKSNIAAVPVSLSHEIAYETAHNVLFNICFSEKVFNNKADIEDFYKLYEKYPFINRNIDFIIQKFNIDFLIIKKQYSYMSLSKSIDVKDMYDFSKFESVFENNDYQVFKLLDINNE